MRGRKQRHGNDRVDPHMHCFGTAGDRHIRAFAPHRKGSRRAVCADGLTPIILLAMLFPAALITGCLTLYPLVIALRTSFTTSEGPSLTNYIEFFSDPGSYGSIVKTFVLSCIATLGCLLLSLPLAYALRRATRGRMLLRLLVTTPLAVPVLIAVYGLNMFIAEHGILNNLLVDVLGIIRKPLPLSYNLGSIVFGCIWRYFPYATLLVSAGLEGLDPRLEEAGYSAGASRTQVFLIVVFPLLRPALVAGAVLTFVGIFGTFSIPLVMGGGGQDVLSVMAYRAIQGRSDFAEGSTIVVVMTVIQLLIFAVFRWTVAANAPSSPRWPGEVGGDANDRG